MPARPALRAALAAAAALVLAACQGPGTSVPSALAQKLAVGTGDITTACGYADELTAFGDHAESQLRPLQAMAAQGADKLALVYRHTSSDIYQGESIGAVLHGAIALLGECGLPAARRPLERALTPGR
jgi:hypothetical protein